LNEAVARTIFKQVVKAVQCCHSRGVCHRDVKDENILLSSKTLHVKLIDFGCGARLRENQTPYTEFAGTPEFYPPEWYTNRSYDGKEAAVWSLGILLYTMIEGHVPFQRPKDIIRARLKFSRFDQLTLSIIDIIQWMVTVDAKKRPTLKELSKHPWLQHVD
jgi:serine/threonine protein kinase